MDPTAPNANENKPAESQNQTDQSAQPAVSTPAPEPQEQSPEQPEQPTEQSDQAENKPLEQSPQTNPAAGSPAKKDDDQPPIPPQISNLLAKNHILLPIILIVIVILCVAIFALLMGDKKSSKNENMAPTPTPGSVKSALQPTPVPAKTQTLVYGTWTSQSSVVRTVNVETGTIKTVATLPLTIKKITVLSPTTLLYIDQTDSNDHGARISVYNIQQKQITTNIPAASGYGIDDYILSPDKRYLAIWEVQFAPNSQTLQGGASRVYAVDLTQPSVVNLLYDEQVTPTIPIHYPRAILSNGTVFTDQFIPNDPKGGTGWAYGMSKVDFDGTNKLDIQSMTNGTYGSQPVLSPDGKFLLFAGYDGSNGDGTAVKNGYRQALLTPNTVELLDVNSLNRYKLPNLPPSNTYSDVQWDKQTANVIISILSPDSKQMGVYSYDLGQLQYNQIPMPLANNTQYGYISQLSNTETLIGIQSTDPSNLGNLGESYAFAYTQLATIDQNKKLTYISVQDPFVQYITLLPGDYFTNVLGAQTKNQAAPQPSFAVLQGTQQNNPQNYNFFLKTTLASLRIQGKSNPPGSPDACQNLGTARCSALGLTPKSASFITCQNIENANNRTANACY